MAKPAEQVDREQDAANAVSIHMSSYYPENLAAWFAQIDSAFINARITSSASKLHLANSKLAHAIYDSIADMVTTATTAADPYNALKTRLCDSFGLTPAQKIAALLDHPSPGDQKPSVLLDKIWALKPASMDELLNAIFFRRMPAYIRDMVHARNFNSQELAAVCNKIWGEREGAAAASSHRPGAPNQGAPTDASREEETGAAARLQAPRPGRHGRTRPATANTTAPTGPTATADHHAFRKTN